MKRFWDALGFVAELLLCVIDVVVYYWAIKFLLHFVNIKLP